MDMKVNPYTTFTTETAISLIEINHALKNLKNWMKNEICETPLMFFPGKVYKQYQPLGTTLVIGSWNYPYATTLTPLISAIAAGNPCIVKPSEGSSNCSQVIRKIIDSLD